MKKKIVNVKMDTFICAKCGGTIGTLPYIYKGKKYCAECFKVITK